MRSPNLPSIRIVPLLSLCGHHRNACLALNLAFRKLTIGRPSSMHGIDLTSTTSQLPSFGGLPARLMYSSRCEGGSAAIPKIPADPEAIHREESTISLPNVIYGSTPLRRSPSKLSTCLSTAVRARARTEVYGPSHKGLCRIKRPRSKAVQESSPHIAHH